MWRLQEKVLGVEELGASHQGATLAEVVYCVLEELDLTQKVSNYYLTIVHYQSSMHNVFNRFLLSQFITQVITSQWWQAWKKNDE